MKPAPRWVVPLESGQVAEGAPAIAVEVDTADLTIALITIGEPSLEALLSLSSLVAVQLGQALQDAAAWCGQEQGRRDRRGKPEAPRMTLEEIVAHSEAQRAMSDPIARIEGALTTLAIGENPPPGWQKRVIAATKLCALLTAFRDGELQGQAGDAFREHLAKCHACQAELLHPVDCAIDELRGEKGPTR